MSDHSQEPGRVDFRAISGDPEFADVDRVMAAVWRRHSAERAPLRPTVVTTIVAHSRTLVAAAAILIAIATLTISLPQRDGLTVAPEAALASWAQTNHVPTNAELLLAFRGYGK